MKKTKRSRRWQNIRLLCFSALSLVGLYFASGGLHGWGLQSGKQSAEANLLDGEWGYLASATAESSGLRIHDRRLAIVEQDGSGGVPNSPINIFGTYAEVSGDVAVSITMRDVNTSEASVDLYGEVPIILDEMRLERKRLRLAVGGGTLKVSVWDDSQTPVVTEEHAFSPAAEVNVELERKGSSLLLRINNQAVTTIDRDLFSSGKVWFGADSREGQWLLSGLRVRGLSGGGVQAVDGSDVRFDTVVAGDALQRLAGSKRADFRIGAAGALGPSATDTAYGSLLFGGDFGLVTFENALKWQFVHPQTDTYTFQEADALLKLAQRYNLAVHGHALVFGEANSRWVQNLPADQLQAAMVDHIKTVVGRYKGKITSWDVVNEPFDDNQSALRPHLWYKAMGEGYIATAFRTAYGVDPDAQLFINEYGLESDGERWEAMLALVKRLKAEGVPIDGVGFQAHVYEPADRINPETLRKHIKQLGQLDLKARVSEMDVYGYEGQEVQAQQYADVFNVCLSEPNCASFTTWGVSDRYNWYRDDEGIFQQGQDFLWDEDVQPTLAVEAIRALLRPH